jgi:ribonuclease R
MSLRFTRRILDHLKHDNYEPGPVEKLAEDLGIDAPDMPEFRNAVKSLADQKSLVLDPSGRVKLPVMGDEITGVFRKNARGFGFVVPDVAYREGDLFIPPDEVSDALTGDIVRVEVVRGMRRGEADTTGRIIEVIKRKRKSFAGELVKRGGQWFFSARRLEVVCTTTVAL